MKKTFNFNYEEKEDGKFLNDKRVSGPFKAFSVIGESLGAFFRLQNIKKAKITVKIEEE